MLQDAHSRTQLWRITTRGHLENVGLSKSRTAKQRRSIVLDIVTGMCIACMHGGMSTLGLALLVELTCQALAFDIRNTTLMHINIMFCLAIDISKVIIIVLRFASCFDAGQCFLAIACS